MHQLTFILSTVFFLHCYATGSDANSIYEDFQKSKTSFLSSKMTKKDFSKKFKNLDLDLNSKYLELKSLEKQELTVEGNQIALDLELLEPLRQLAHTQINKKNCLEAKNLNQLNFTEAEKTQINSIETVLKSICD